MIGFDGPHRRLFEIDRRGEIGEPLGEIDRAVANRQARHFADYGLGEVRRPIALEGFGRQRSHLRQARASG